jgi:hypothetical protein
MKFRLKAGAELDMLTRHELRDELAVWQRDFLAELRRGPQRAEIHSSGTVAATNIIIGVGQYTDSIMAPNKGFAWSVRRLTARGLAAGDTIGIYKSGVLNPQSGTFSGSQVATLTGSNPTQFITKGGLVLFSSEPLSVYGTGLTATGTIEIDGEAAEVPATMAGTFY